MTKYQSLSIYGGLTILTGIFMLAFGYEFSEFIPYAIAVCMIAGAVFSGITAYKSKNKQTQFRYHELHAAGMAIYGICVVIFHTDAERFLSITSFFLIYYGITEIVFCFQLLTMKAKADFQILITRLVAGFVIYLAALLIVIFPEPNQKLTFIGYGILFVGSGIHILFYRPVMKKLDISVAAAEEAATAV